MEELETDYPDARSFLDAARAAAIEAERTRRTLDRMRTREDVHAQTYQPSVAHTNEDVNGTAATVRRMDWEGRMAERIDRNYALIDAACRVIYGPEQDGRGGVAALCGNLAADILWWRFCGTASWAKVARSLGYEESWCRRVADSAIRQMDAVGFDALARPQD